MKTKKTNKLLKKLMILTIFAGLAGACAAKAPNELVDAREAYRRASTGIAAEIAPAELHVANQALAKAEKSFKNTSDSYRTKDLAYVAQRKSEMAEATASILNEKRTQAQSRDDYQATQGKIVKRKTQELRQTRSDLADSKRTGEIAAAKLYAEQEARNAAEKQAFDAKAELAKLAQVNEEPRGMIITLTGSVLFASNQSSLLPQGRVRLNQLADVLLVNPDRNLTIEGHTDSQGSESYNLDLSQKRAETVRNFLMKKGYKPNLIATNGLGQDYPIADNASAEGRANNRRVEIVIERDSDASNR